jgi:formate hydrogenlyase subunit 4
VTAALGALHLVIALTMPILLVGIVNRTKARWAGRKGPGLVQSAWDLRRLLTKAPVYSTTSTPLFAAGAWVVFAASLLAALVAPILGNAAPLRFDYDFILFAYALGLARLFLMLSAMDVGSAFEGMGAAREGLFTVVSEPALFFLLGAAALATGQASFAGLMGQWHHAASFPWLVVPAVAVLFVLLQTEAARLPVDDPQTHLELTMVHEVMLLDHSGPGLAAMQYAAAMKMTIYAGLIASLVNPFDLRSSPAPAILFALAAIAGVGVAVGCVESLVARLRMRSVPGYLMLASLTAAACLGVAGWLARLP